MEESSLASLESHVPGAAASLWSLWVGALELIRAEDRDALVRAILSCAERQVDSPHLWLLDREENSLHLVATGSAPSRMLAPLARASVASPLLPAEAFRQAASRGAGPVVSEPGPDFLHHASALGGEEGPLAVLGWLGEVDGEDAIPATFPLLGELLGAAVQRLSADDWTERLHRKWSTMVLHELRQPITLIHGFAGVLFSDDELAPHHYGKLQHIRSAAQRLNRLAQDLLDITRQGAQQITLRKRRIDLLALIRRVVEQTDTELPDNDVRIEIACPIPPLDADPVRIEQVLTNLLGNAGKYGTKGRPIVVRVDCPPGEVCVQVINEGENLPEQDIERLFRPFYRSREARRKESAGFGLGLHISRGIIEAHGGRIWGEAVPGGGLCVSWTLPLSPSD